MYSAHGPSASRPSPPATVNPFSFPSSAFFNPPTSNSLGKRRAHSPPPSPQPSPSTPSWSASDPSTSKRRRPNLANGFSSLSLATPAQDSSDQAGPSTLPSYIQSQHLEDGRRSIEDDDINEDLDPFYDRNDVDVQEIHIPRQRNASARSSCSETSASDTELNLRRLSRRGRPPQQQDEVEQPPPDTIYDQDVDVEDVTPRIGVKRRSHSAEDGRRAVKRPRDEMDVDMSEIEEIPRGRQKSQWYEPEKDSKLTNIKSRLTSGIVYTALSASSSRSSSPDPKSASAVQLSQPGDNGFTISPSMLTRLLAAHNHPAIPPLFPLNREMGMVLYRPLGMASTENFGAKDVEDIVREWQDKMRAGEHSGRFESVDEDEDLTLNEVVPVTVDGEAGDMDIDM